MLILRTFLGFAFQILPYAFFCIYPFADHFKIRLSNALWIFGSAFIVLSAMFTWIGVHAGIPFLEEYRTLLMNLFFYIALAFFFTMYFLFIRAYIFQKIFVFFIVMNYGYLVTMAVNLLLDIFPYTPDGHMYPLCSLLFHFLINAALFYPMLLLSRHIRHAVNCSVEKRLWKLLSLVPGIFMLITGIVYILPPQANIPPESLHLTFLYTMLLYMLFIYTWIFRILEIASEKSLQQAKLEMLVENYRKNAESIAVIRQIRHETTHHANALSLYLKSGDYEGAQSYLDSFSCLVSEMPVIEYTSHPLLNAMLSEYRERGDRNGITVRYDIAVSERLAMQDTDLCCLLTNMLDNAYEACSHVEASRRYVNLNIRLNRNFLFFSCENSCNASWVHYVNGTPVTTKNQNSMSHGFGISIMKEISAKYNGAFQIKRSGNRFFTYVNLCLLADQPDSL